LSQVGNKADAKNGNKIMSRYTVKTVSGDLIAETQSLKAADLAAQKYFCTNLDMPLSAIRSSIDTIGSALVGSCLDIDNVLTHALYIKRA
jgi:hypothetical protein